MKKKYLYIIIGILVFIIICFATHEKSTSIVANPKETGLLHDFGIINKDKIQLYKYKFKYINKNFDSIKIYGVMNACDCTYSNVKTGYYLKNDTIDINLEYNPHKYKDSGLVIKQLFLITDKTVSKYDTIYPLTLKGIVQ